MKRISIFAAVTLLTLLGATNAVAQTEKGNFVISGSSSFSVVNSSIEKIDHSSTTTITLSPSFGYFVTNNVAIGLDVSLISISGSTSYGVRPTVSYYLNNGNRFIPKASLGIGYAGTSIDDVNVGGLSINAGLSGVYMMMRNVGLSIGLVYERNMYSFEGIKLNQNNFGGAIGFEIFF